MMSKPSLALRPLLDQLELRRLPSGSKPSVDTRLAIGGNSVNPTVSRLGSTAEVQITRPTGRGQVQVEITTPTPDVDSDFAAQPGVDFQPIDQVITFAPGQTGQTVQVPLIHPSSHASRLGLAVTGHILSPATASNQDFGGDVYLVDRADATGPKVISSHLINSGSTARGVALTFDEPLNPASVSEPSYQVIMETPNRSGGGGRPIILEATASLDPTNTTLTLTLRKPRRLASNQFIGINSILSGLTSSSFDGGVTDAAGNAIQVVTLEFSTARPIGKAPAPPKS